MEKDIPRDISIVEKEFGFQKKEWFIHHISWTLMGVFLILGLIGIWGTGPLSKRKAENEVFDLEYERFMRVKKDFELKVTLKNNYHSPEVSINADYFQRVKVKEIFPKPVSVKATKDQLIFTFDEIDKGVIIFYLDPDKMGNQNLEIMIDSRKEEVHQYIYF